MAIARKIIFYLFLLIYLILCPLLILYSLGYIYQPVSKDVSQTGLIYLATNPPGADVYLGRSHFRKKTPTTITELNPGEYKVSLKLKKRRWWVHHLKVEAGKSATLDDILLLPQEFSKISLMPQTTFTDLVAVKDADYFILKRGSRLQDFYIFNWQQETIKPLITRTSKDKVFKVTRLFTAQDSKAIIAYGGSLWNKDFFYIDIDNTSSKLSQITKLLPKMPKTIIWQGASLENIFAVYKNYINRLNIPEKSLYPEYFTQIKGFGLSSQGAYILDNDNAIFRIIFGKQKKVKLFQDQHLGKYLFNISDFYKIQELEEKIILFLGERGDLIITITPYQIFNKGILGVKYNRPHKKFLFWSQDNIWYADLASKDNSQRLFTNYLDVNQVYTQGKDIRQCFWIYKASHILFKDANTVYLLQLMPYGRHHCQKIVEVKPGTQILYKETTGYLYYLNRKGKLTKIKILPGKQFALNSLVPKSKQDRDE
jgi:hypothetical protein